MEIHINTSDLETSNRFLRALWAEFRDVFGKFHWQPSLNKDGENKIIQFGYIKFSQYYNEHKVMLISISYKQRGTINNIDFIFPFSETQSEPRKNSEIGIKLTHCVNFALEKINNPKQYIFEIPIYSIFGSLGLYTGYLFSIIPISEKESKLILKANGYDVQDARREFKRKVISINDFLCVETNYPFKCDFNAVKISTDNNTYFNGSKDLKNQIFNNDEDWIDGIPVHNQKIIISKSGKMIIDKIAEQRIGEKLRKFLKACRHFFNARQYETHKGYDMEVSSVLYMSSLEVASLIEQEENSKSCKECGQPVYSISQRVRKLVDENVSPHIAEIIKDLYTKRSKYLHTGYDLSFQEYLQLGDLRPQLDPNNPTGCETYPMYSSIQVHEFVSFCLRKISRNIVK